MDGGSKRGNFSRQNRPVDDQFDAPTYELNIDLDQCGEEENQMDPPLINRRVPNRQYRVGRSSSQPNVGRGYPTYHQGGASAPMHQFAYNNPYGNPFPVHSGGGFVNMMQGGDIYTDVTGTYPPYTNPYGMQSQQGMHSPPPVPTRTPGSDSSKKSSRRSDATDDSVSSPRKKTKQKSTTASQHKVWLPEHDITFIPFLAELAREKTYKCDKGFKTPGYNAAAEHVNITHGTEFNGENAKNHYRTLRQRLKDLKHVLTLSGAGWDDAEKMVTLSGPTYDDYVAKHPGARPYINKPIPWYDDLLIICGDDQAKGELEKVASDLFFSTYSSSSALGDEGTPETAYTPSPTEDGIHAFTQNPSCSQGHPGSNQSTPTSTSVGGTKQKRRGGQQNSQPLGANLDNVADAIRTAFPNWTAEMQKAVYEFEEYGREMLYKMYKSLLKNKREGKGFVALPQDGRKMMLEEIYQELTGGTGN